MHPPEKPPETPSPQRRAYGFFLDVRSVFTTRIATLSLKFGASILLARALGPDDRGLLTAIILIPFLLVSITEAGIRQSAAYHISKKIFSDPQVFAGLVLIFVTFSTAGVMLSLYVFDNFGFEEVPLSTRILASMIIPLGLVLSYSSGIFLGKRQIVRFNRTFWIPEALRVTLLLSIFLTINLTVELAISAQLVASISICCYAVHLLSSIIKLKLSINWKVIKSLLNIGMGFGLSLFLIILNYKISTLILHRFSTSEQVGYFAVALTLAELIWQLPTVLNSLLFERSATRTKGRDFSFKVLALMRLTVGAAAIASIGMISVAPFLIPLAFGTEFSPSIPVLAALLPGMVLMCVFKILVSEMGGMGHPWLSLLATVPSIIINAAIGFMLVPSLGAIGAGAATSIAYFFSSAIYCLVYSRVVGISLFKIVLPRKTDFAFLAESVPGMSRFLSAKFNIKF
ncbi:MAG: oligosaccharide flippase family protein [Pontixanthobacter sp.]